MKEDRYFVIDSHRGVFKNGLLENSIPAFKESYYEGANCVECDIRISKDGEIILLHNSSIDHIVSFAEKLPDFSEFQEHPEGKLKEHSLKFLKSIQFPNNATILTLTEFLELLKDLKLGAQIELKEMGYEDKILRIIEEAEIDYTDHIAPIVCTSFNWYSILRMIKYANSGKYHIPLYKHSGKKGLAFGLQAIPLKSFYGNWVLRQCHKKDIWGFMTYYKNLPINKIDYAHKYGVKFCPRVPNDKDLVMNYIQAGVDGFETDNIKFIRKCIIESGYELSRKPTRTNN